MTIVKYKIRDVNTQVLFQQIKMAPDNEDKQTHKNTKYIELTGSNHRRGRQI